MFTQELFESSREIWEGFLVHPFILEMGQGNLAKEKFRDYLVQDYLYLIQYAKLFAAGVLKSNTVEEIKLFEAGISGALEDETAVHIEYLNSFGISAKQAETLPSHMTNVAYTSYMQGIALTGDLKELVATLLPCIWSYYYIGEYMSTKYEAQLENNYYTPWIASYSSEDYKECCEKWIEYMNRLAEYISAEEKQKLIGIFKTSSIFEMEFWNMAYNG